MMWLPRPITQPFPTRSTGESPSWWPGTRPAVRLTSAPISAPAPTSIHASP